MEAVKPPDDEPPDGEGYYDQLEDVIICCSAIALAYVGVLAGLLLIHDLAWRLYWTGAL